MKFKNQELTRTKVKNNILKVWELCEESDKFDWYADANKFALDYVETFDSNGRELKEFKLNKMIGYLSALSPLKTWNQNKQLASDFYLTGKAGHMSLNVNKCKRIAESDGTDESILSILNGNKICSFYLNIKYYDKCQNVTIDRHALSIALGYQADEKEQSGITKNQYEFFVQCYMWTAMKLNVSPLLLQSATWTKYRKLTKEEKSNI